ARDRREVVEQLARHGAPRPKGHHVAHLGAHDSDWSTSCAARAGREVAPWTAVPIAKGSPTPEPIRALPTVDDDEEWRRVASRAVALCGTPAYITRQRPIEAALRQVEAGFGNGVRSWLSFKTHPLPALLQWWLGTGRGVEVVSAADRKSVVEGKRGGGGGRRGAG